MFLFSSKVSLCRVSVAIAHYFGETSKDVGYGSTRVGAGLARQVALSRCLGSVLGLGRQPNDVILNPAERVIEVAPPRQDNTTQLAAVAIDLHLFVTGDAYLKEICNYFSQGSRFTIWILKIHARFLQQLRVGCAVSRRLRQICTCISKMI